jgi:16S rRNA (adenine1518-N6/adenine1519-N6)-dimethyltransferase
MQKTHKAKKTLGQNFLKSEQALREIVKAGDIKLDDTVLEIGPGKGALTERLLENSVHVIAIEKDHDLVAFLNDKFKEEIENKKLTLIEGDVLELEMSKVIFKTYKIIANIPYNITGAILKKFLTEEIQPELMVLLVQKEVADRIIARDHKESLLSLSVKVYGVPTYIMKVGARYFSPAPKVDSAVIKINKISRDFFSKNEINESLFWELARAGFAHKRKILAGNLKSWRTGVDWQKLLADSGVSKNARAEDLILDNWISVLKHLE